MNVNPLILSDARLDPDGNLKPGYMDLRHRLQEDLMSSAQVINDIDTKFEKIFGRRWDGLCWEYRMEGAEHAIVSMGRLRLKAPWPRMPYETRVFVLELSA